MANHYNNEENSLHETMEQWTCPQCYKAISSTRPPVFNAANCSCVEAASHTNGHISHTSPYGQTVHQPAQQVYHVPESNASTNLTVPSPEGPERADPNLIQAPSRNAFLPLGPEPGHNESQARRSSSFHDNLPYSLQAFLNSPEYYPNQYPVFEEESCEQPRMQFIPQGVHLQAQSSMRQNVSSRRSKPSAQSGQTSWSGEASRFSWEVDPTTGIGSWMDEEGNLYSGDGGENVYSYPLGMSGLSE